MCCILSCFRAHASLGLIEDASTLNDDGIGIAWIDRKTNQVRWRKGLTAGKTFQISRDLPFPYMIHARMATVGGRDPVLTHPFPIAFKPSLALEGSAERVLMHNGHFADWRGMAEMIGLQLPKNPRGWSDSRVIAAAVHVVGPEVLKMLESNRFALMSARTGLEIFGDWLKVEEGLYASSDPRPRYVGYSRFMGNSNFYSQYLERKRERTRLYRYEGEDEDGTYEDAVRQGLTPMLPYNSPDEEDEARAMDIYRPKPWDEERDPHCLGD